MAIKLPAKLLKVSILSSTPTEKWVYNDGLGDKWWQGGSDPRFYRWDLDITVNEQVHSSHLTREPYRYNGFDIKVGDWIAHTSSGLAAKIIGTKAKTASTMTITVEDINRYNTFRDPSGLGNGDLGVGTALIFTLNEEGEPLLDTLTSGYVSEIFYSNLMGRFENLNAEYDFNLTQPGHTFSIGDLISAYSANNQWVRASSTFNFTVGRVTALGPTPDQFYITPIQRVIDDLDYLPGGVASLLYADSNEPSGVTTTANDNLVYVKLRDQTSTSITSDITPISATPGSTLGINGTNVSFSVGNEADVVASINAVTGQTGVTASTIASPTVVTPNVGNLGYGVVGSLGNTAQATINGILVSFNITIEGSVAFGTTAANAKDMADAIARDVTSVNSDIIAYSAAGLLYIEHLTGGSITLSTVTTDGSGFNFEGPGSTSGLPAVTAGSTDSYLRLTKDDAGAIELSNVSGVPMDELGIYTVENGQKAAALYVEKGISAANTLVVPNIAARDALNPGIGDQAYVIDSGVGEWAMYLFDGSEWVLVTNQDSSNTDAKTLTATFTAPYGAGESPNEITLGTISPGRKITTVSVDVVTAFNTASNAILTVGTALNQSLFFDENSADLTDAMTYFNSPEYLYSNAGLEEMEVKCWLTHSGATQGEVVVKLTYI